MTEELIRLDLIDDNPEQHRDVYKDIEDLGRSIASNGLEQIPTGRMVNGRCQLKIGHRRKRSWIWLKDNWQKEGLADRYNGYSVMPVNLSSYTDEEMFDGMVIENAHRDDLKVTEKAWLLRRYKEVHPDATSEQIGLVFNMAPATVRGMDIFLDLPKPVQERLDDGTINQDTARKIHSMQKITNEKVILDTIAQIEKKKGDVLPEAIIEDAIEHKAGALKMWDSDFRGEGKPRSDWRGGWLLDMKNFPNKLLTQLTLEEAIQALGINPKDAQAVAKINTWRMWKFDQLNATQEKIDEMGLAVEVIARMEHLINPSACTACPFYTKIRGTHYCGMRTCHERKTAAWSVHLTEQASKNLGIAIYDKSKDGMYRALSWPHESLFKSRHKDLRLIPAEEIDGNVYQSFSGVNDDAFVVVATGSAIDKMSSSRSGGVSSPGKGKKTEKEKIEMRRMKLYRAYRKQLLWDFTITGKAIFNSVPLAALESLNGWRYLDMDNRPTAEEPDKKADPQLRLEWLSRCAVLKLIEQCSSHYRRETLASILKDLENFAKLWDLKIPAALRTNVAKWDAEIDAVSTATAKAKK